MTDEEDKAELWRRYANDPEFYLRVSHVRRRLHYEFGMALDSMSPDRMDLAACRIVRDLFPDAEWLARQEKQRQAILELLTGPAPVNRPTAGGVG